MPRVARAVPYLGFILVRGWRWLVILRASAPAARLDDATAVTAIEKRDGSSAKPNVPLTPPITASKSIR